MNATADTAFSPPAHRPGDADAIDLVDDARRRAHDLDRSVRRFVVERPVVAVAAALAGGFLIGRLLQRL